MPRPLSEQARQKAIDATQELVATHGIEGFTIDGVAKRSGVAKTTLYRHWSSSNELLVHAIDCQVERIPTPDTGTLRGDLSELLTMMLTVIAIPGSRQLFLDLMGKAARDPEFALVHDAMKQERHRPIGEIVRRAIDRGEIPTVELDLASLLVEGPLLARLLHGPDVVEPEEIPPIVDFIARGLGSADVGVLREAGQVDHESSTP